MSLLHVQIPLLFMYTLLKRPNFTRCWDRTQGSMHTRQPPHQLSSTAGCHYPTVVSTVPGPAWAPEGETRQGEPADGKPLLQLGAVCYSKRFWKLVVLEALWGSRQLWTDRYGPQGQEGSWKYRRSTPGLVLDPKFGCLLSPDRTVGSSILHERLTKGGKLRPSLLVPGESAGR